MKLSLLIPLVFLLAHLLGPTQAITVHQCRRLADRRIARLLASPQYDGDNCRVEIVRKRIVRYCERVMRCENLSRGQCRPFLDARLALLFNRLGCRAPAQVVETPAPETDAPDVGTGCQLVVEYDMFEGHGNWDIGLTRPVSLLTFPDNTVEPGSYAIDYTLELGETYEFLASDNGNAARFPDTRFQGVYRLVLNGNLFADGNVDAAEYVTFQIASDRCEVVPAPSRPFKFDFIYDSSVNASLVPIFEQAAARWSAVIAESASLKEFVVNGNRFSAQDAVVEVSFSNLPAAGEIALGTPAGFRSERESWRPFYGLIQIDPANLQTLVAVGADTDEALLSVVTHELGHILGVGPIWVFFRTDLVDGDGYIGQNALRQYRSYNPGPVSSVPISVEGSDRTAFRHWRENVFDNEIMTGVIDPGFLPISRITIGFLQDIGYSVRYGRADPYSLPVSGEDVVDSFQARVEDGFKLLGSSMVKPEKKSFLIADTEIPDTPEELDTLVEETGFLFPQKRPRSL